ncbi:MAG: nitroreductase/quinone reductase family protein, partial [Actinomycetes bacterium]
MSTSTHSHTGPTRQPARNRCVIAVLRSGTHRLLPRSLALLTVTGVRTGRRITFPVGTVRDADGTLLVLVGKARDKTWWRNLVGGG